jgi:hypothetical protein
MARLSKADWNKLQKATGMKKGSLQRGVKWTVSKERKGWTRMAAKASAVKGGSDAV